MEALQKTVDTLLKQNNIFQKEIAELKEYKTRNIKTVSRLQEVIEMLNDKCAYLEDFELKKKDDEIKELKKSVTENINNDSIALLKAQYKECNNLATKAHIYAEYAINMMNIRTDGCLLWKINNFDKHLLRASSDNKYYIISQQFYTHIEGYKLFIILYPNYENNMLIHVILAPGEYDLLLSWPIKKAITMRINAYDNHDDDIVYITQTNMIVKQPPDINQLVGIFKIPNTFIQQKKHIQNNIIFIKIKVN